MLRTTNKTKQSDLIWKLEGITNQQEAFEFLKIFENFIFVYSYMVEKIYSNYTFIFPREDYHKIAVLPNHEAFHDIFHYVKNDAIEETDAAIFPGDIIGEKNIVIKLPKHKYSPTKILPLHEGIAYLQTLYEKEGKTFLPVISNGDLREYENRMPCLYLHNVNTKTLENYMSVFHTNNIKNAINESLEHMLNNYREV